MWGFSGHQTVVCTFATGATISSAIPTRGSNHVAIELETFAVGLAAATANVYVLGCKTASGTFRRIMDEGNYSAGAAIADWEVPSTIGNKTVVCRPAARFDYIKYQFSQDVTAPIRIWTHLHD